MDEENINTQEQNEEVETQLDKLKRRIPYDEDIHHSEENYESLLKDLLEDSMYIGLSILFPFRDFSKIEFPTRYYNWQIRTCVELYYLAGKDNISSYHENGLSWTKFKSGLSQDLLNELIPNVGTPERISIESEDDTNV